MHQIDCIGRFSEETEHPRKDPRTMCAAPRAFKVRPAMISPDGRPHWRTRDVNRAECSSSMKPASPVRMTPCASQDGSRNPSRKTTAISMPKTNSSISGSHQNATGLSSGPNRSPTSPPFDLYASGDLIQQCDPDDAMPRGAPPSILLIPILV